MVRRLHDITTISGRGQELCCRNMNLKFRWFEIEYVRKTVLSLKSVHSRKITLSKPWLRECDQHLGQTALGIYSTWICFKASINSQCQVPWFYLCYPREWIFIRIYSSSLQVTDFRFSISGYYLFYRMSDRMFYFNPVKHIFSIILKS